MIRQRSFGAAIALVAALALLALFLPGGAFAQGGDASTAGSGQSGQVIGHDSSDLHMNSTGAGTMHMNGMGHGTQIRHVGAQGMGNGAHVGNMMGGMTDMSAMHQNHMSGTGECPQDGEHATECPYPPAITTNDQ